RCALPISTLVDLLTEAQVSQPSLIEEIKATIRQSGEDQCGNGIQDQTGASFGPLAILNIDARSIPLDDVPMLVPDRHLMVKHPAIFPVCPPHTRFMQEGFPTGYRCAPLVHHSFDVFRMNC